MESSQEETKDVQMTPSMSNTSPGDVFEIESSPPDDLTFGATTIRWGGIATSHALKTYFMNPPTFNEPWNYVIWAEISDGLLPYERGWEFPARHVPKGTVKIGDTAHFIYYCYFVSNDFLMPDWTSDLAQ